MFFFLSFPISFVRSHHIISIVLHAPQTLLAFFVRLNIGIFCFIFCIVGLNAIAAVAVGGGDGVCNGGIRPKTRNQSGNMILLDLVGRKFMMFAFANIDCYGIWIDTLNCYYFDCGRGLGFIYVQLVRIFFKVLL